jgi:hypothetical protein
VLDDLVAAGVPDEQAKIAIKAIVQSKIRHVTIRY